MHLCIQPLTLFSVAPSPKSTGRGRGETDRKVEMKRNMGKFGMNMGGVPIDSCPS